MEVPQQKHLLQSQSNVVFSTEGGEMEHKAQRLEQRIKLENEYFDREDT